MKFVCQVMGLLWLLLALSAAWGEPGPPAPLVTPEWLRDNLHRDDLVVLDIRNAIGGDSRWSYVASHVPGAVYSDYVSDRWHERGNPVPTTLPPTGQIEALLGDLGITNRSLVVVVHSGMHSSDFSTAARVYWIFKLMSHERVAILDGGFRGWKAAGYPVEQGWIRPSRVTYSAAFSGEPFADTDTVVAASQRGAQLVDARARSYYLGIEKPNLASRYGTIPNAVNLPHGSLVDPETGRFISKEQLERLLQNAGLRRHEDTIVFCSIGHWSAAVWFALSEIAGYERVSLYDGSMVEWTAAPERPVEIGVEIGATGASALLQ